jgi:uncharacterized protein (TIGR02452 family)
MSLKAVAQETLAICERGSYRAPSGREVAIDAARAVNGTVLYKPAELPRDPVAGIHRTRVTVTEETTAAAARRMGGQVAVLNFASARNVGGGFINGARAQEEDLCRKSGLYPCLLTARAYYDQNRAHESALYTDHLIYSPGVPFFRDEDLALLEEPFTASVVTSPAPNAGALRTDRERAQLRATFVRRIGHVLSVFAAQGHPRIVLGAWGCGAFHNDPVVVAELFDEALRGPFAEVFSEVVFAIYDRAKGTPCLNAFRARLAR